jgi:hypothetical protein
MRPDELLPALIPGLDALGLFEVMEVRDENLREFTRTRLRPGTPLPKP